MKTGRRHMKIGPIIASQVAIFVFVGRDNF
jgi:hypothetical protein